MKKSVFLFLIVFVCQHSLAQDTLPRISVTGIGTNVLVSWTNPFITLTTINIQRSFDSIKNFTTIGSVLDVTNKRNGYIDTRPLTPNMYYRIFLSFEGGTYLFTKSSRAIKDTTKAIADIRDFQQSVNNSWFVPSRTIYTGKDNNVIISLPDAGKKKYTVKFFEENGTFLFELRKITETYLTLEKVNFLRSGIFNFELYENGILIEKHKVYVPKDGKQVPNIIEMGKNPIK